MDLGLGIEVESQHSLSLRYAMLLQKNIPEIAWLNLCFSMRMSGTSYKACSEFSAKRTP